MPVLTIKNTVNKGSYNFQQCFNFMCILFIADACLNPQVNSEVYTSTESHMSYETVFVIEFTLTCKNGLKVSLAMF